MNIESPLPQRMYFLPLSCGYAKPAEREREQIIITHRDIPRSFIKSIHTHIQLHKHKEQTFIEKGDTTHNTINALSRLDSTTTLNHSLHRKRRSFAAQFPSRLVLRRA